MEHTEKCCWKKNEKGVATFVNYLKVLVNDGEATLVELNWVCGVKNNIFFGTRIPRRNLVVTLEVDKDEK
jgi:hypothetical protein